MSQMTYIKVFLSNRCFLIMIMAVLVCQNGKITLHISLFLAGTKRIVNMFRLKKNNNNDLWINKIN